MAINPDLKEAFGNESWTAVDFYREVMLDIAAEAEYTLELGSGLTSMDLARAGVCGLALEHSERWMGYLEGVSVAIKFDWGNFNVALAPLKDFGDYEWFDIPTKSPISLDRLIDFIVCDGPPRLYTKGNRIGALPRLYEKLVPGCLILFDDYYINDGGDTAAEIDAWKKDFGVETVEIYSPTEGTPFALLRVP